MKTKKIKILWISLFAPVSTDYVGGSKTFNAYFKRFANDRRFELRLIASGKPELKADIEKENNDIDKYIIYWSTTWRERIKNITNIESKWNLFNRNANLISNSLYRDILNKIIEYKNNGYIPDVVIFEWTQMLPLVFKVKEIFPNVRLIASEHDVTFVGYKRKFEYYTGLKKMMWAIKYIREKKLEIKALKECDLILPHNSSNIEILHEEGIDYYKMQWLTPYFYNMSNNICEPDNMTILFFGAMGRPENYLSAIWFIEKVMPLLDDINIQFIVLGGGPPEQLRRYVCNNIQLTGYIEKIESYFSKAMCFVAPLILGAGIKIKVIEALSSGIPVLTNSIGAEGIDIVDKRDFYHCELPIEYANVIKKIYYKQYKINVGDYGRDYIVKNFSVDISYKNYCERIVKMVKG